MSIGRRIFKAAGYRIRQGIDTAVGGAASAFDAARAELDDHLSRPVTPRTPPPTSPYGSTTAPQANPYAREYRLLGAPIGSDLKTVQVCWRKLVRENHPDRFHNDPPEQQRAGERLRKINEAYDRLKQHLA